MSLNDTLDNLRAEMTAEGKAAFNELLSAFDKQALKEHALRRGDPMPDFILPNAEGRLVSSEELRQDSALIISFYRGSWCAYCGPLLQAFDAMIDRTTKDRKIALLALSPETGGRARSFKMAHNLECEVLVDVDNAVAALFGVVVRLPKRYRKFLLDRGVSAEALHGHEGWFIPLASTFVVSKEGTVVHSEIHIDHTRRTELDNFPGILEALSPKVQD